MLLKLSAALVALVGVHQVQAFAKAASQIQRVSAKDALIQGSASRQLALFQKYAEDLVVSHLQNQDPPAPDESQMMTIINEFIADMYAHSLFNHNKDAEVGSDCQDQVEGCFTDFWSETIQKQLDIEKAAVESSREAHKQCRDVQAHACENSDSDLGFLTAGQIESTHSCSTYTEYRKQTHAAVLPNCAKLTAGMAPTSADAMSEGLNEKGLTDGLISADEKTAAGVADLETMEACLREMKKWTDDGWPARDGWQNQAWPGPPGLYPRYEQCSANSACCADPASCMEPPEEPGFCCSRQTQFLSDHCGYETIRQTDCHNVNNCRARREKACKTDCDAVELRVISRQADNETMERIQCLLNVFTIDDAVAKQAKLTMCKASLTDGSDFATELNDKRDFWNIEGCPPTFEDHPSDDHCHLPMPMQTCSTLFKQKEFGAWSSDLMCSCSNYCAAAMIASDKHKDELGMD